MSPSPRSRTSGVGLYCACCNKVEHFTLGEVERIVYALGAAEADARCEANGSDRLYAGDDPRGLMCSSGGREYVEQVVLKPFGYRMKAELPPPATPATCEFCGRATCDGECVDGGL